MDRIIKSLLIRIGSTVTEISVRVKSVRPDRSFLDTKTGPAGQNLVDQV